MNPKMFRNSFVYLVVFVAVVAVLFSYLQSPVGDTTRSLGWMIDEAKAGNVFEIEVSGDKLKVSTIDQRQFTVVKEPNVSVVSMLVEAGVSVGEGQGKVDVKPSGGSTLGSIFGFLISFAPLIFFGAILIFFMRQAQGGNCLLYTSPSPRD